ncbi:hypothetical protein [Lentiprolixibacter aurantiacus]|uniref:Uncharacterized protein n=1 Tax=Lentiprolixibacter aurantiacus TaxID=2993939 RepID=A0AAE3MK36_9FLAO|nr:hypothetical protein [Lentiprolixibacter aurantiacus]MCX2718791.1 hypothetical protein [Lentiprolixibacter aurantiacus]
MKKLLLLGLGLLISTAIYAQRGNNPVYWNSWEYTAKEGMRQKFEEAAAKKTAMFNNTPETAITTYRIITGPDTGNYFRVQGNKSAADYDRDRSAEGKYWEDNVAKYVGNDKGHVRWQRLNNGSYDPNPDDTSFSKYVSRTFYAVKAGKVMHFRRLMYRMSKVAEKRGWDGRSLYRLVSGGNRNLFVQTAGFDTYKRAESDSPEPDTTTEEDYNEMFGWGSFEEDWDNFNASLEYWGVQRDLMQLVPEMSTGMMN